MKRVDILVTHGPPAGILDRASRNEERMGGTQLLEAVQRVQPLIDVFGHVHGANGQIVVGVTRFINCALLGLDGALTSKPALVRIPRRWLRSNA